MTGQTALETVGLTVCRCAEVMVASKAIRQAELRDLMKDERMVGSKALKKVGLMGPVQAKTRAVTKALLMV